MTAAGCEKLDAWEAQKEINKRRDRFEERIDEYMRRQTTAMEEMARQGEQILSLRRDREEDRRDIDVLFGKHRDQADSCTDARLAINEKISQKADAVPWFRSIPVFAALVSMIIALFSYFKGGVPS